MRRIWCLAALAAVVAASGCSSKPVPGTRIVLERTPCFGICPFYTVTIDLSGRVVYDGVGYYDTIGGDTTKVPMRHDTIMIAPDRVTAIFAAYERAFSRWRPNRYGPGSRECPEQSADAPSLMILRERGASRDTMDVGFGFMCPRPPARITQLGTYIDSVVGIARWLGPAPGSRPAT